MPTPVEGRELNPGLSFCKAPVLVQCIVLPAIPMFSFPFSCFTHSALGTQALRATV